MCGRGWSDYFAVVCSVFSAIGWVQFAFGFGIENGNDEKLRDRGWNNSKEHTLWYIFAVFGILAPLLTIMYATHKKTFWFKAAALSSMIAFVSCGGPLNDSGHYIWQCQQKDSNGLTKQGAGCQEQTYDSYSLIFTGTFTFALFHIASVYSALTAPKETKFSFSYDE